MSGHVAAALFIYSAEGEEYLKLATGNPHGSVVTTAHIDEVRNTPATWLKDIYHVVVAADTDSIKEVMQWAMEYDFSMGFIPLPKQKALYRCYEIPKEPAAMISLALSDETRVIDIIHCNNTILLFKASIGRIPLIDSQKDSTRAKVLWDSLKKITSLRLLPFTITTSGDNKTTTSTAACGCVIFETPERGITSGLLARDCSFADGMVSMVIVAPFSIVDYLKLMWLKLFSNKPVTRLPDSLGYVKSPRLTIESEQELNVTLDGVHETKTPANFKVLPKALNINHGVPDEVLQSVNRVNRETCITQALPAGKELQKARNKRVPFFTYASEERFKDLFIALREDGRINSTYTVLMILSTVLATVGLYLDSASVIIGAMLLAPLMAPIISLAMSLLRHDKKLSKESLSKIGLGIVLALGTSATLTLLSPYQPFTGEMQGRLNPTLLDLTVAIAAGVAGAYTKSYKEILQSLAGVAIAVALVPPLAVAGIGLGRLDLHFFYQAFLLFSTNLIGIVLAATFTFRVLGFSPVVRHKRGVTLVVVSLLLISIPLIMSFNTIVERAVFENSWKQQRFYVNGKYLIVREAILHKFKDQRVLIVDIHAREQIDRNDLNVFKQKVKRHVMEDLVIRAKITYIP